MWMKLGVLITQTGVKGIPCTTPHRTDKISCFRKKAEFWEPCFPDTIKQDRQEDVLTLPVIMKACPNRGQEKSKSQ